MNDTSASAGAGLADDSELVRLAQDGDPAAMEQLLARHFGYVNNLCRRILRDPIDAEDARQDALIQAARSIRTFDGRSAFRTWLHTLTRNVCLNAIRAASRRATPVKEPPEAKLSERTAHGGRRPARGGVVQPHDRIAGQIDVDAALAAVTPAYQDALVLWFIHDLDYAQIAQTLAIPINTVRSRLRRGKAELAKFIGEPSGTSAVSKD